MIGSSFGCGLVPPVAFRLLVLRPSTCEGTGWLCLWSLKAGNFRLARITLLERDSRAGLGSPYRQRFLPGCSCGTILADRLREGL
jgi:hypothetical protein